MEICDPHNLNGIETGVRQKHYLTSVVSPLKSIWHCAVTDYRGLNVNIMIQITVRVNRASPWPALSALRSFLKCENRQKTKSTCGCRESVTVFDFVFAVVFERDGHTKAAVFPWPLIIFSQNKQNWVLCR